MNRSELLNRSELQQLSNERIDDARVLLTTRRWSGAYYLAGYALECALKSCILAHIDRTGIIFYDKKFAEQCWTHDIMVLVKQAGLKIERAKAIDTNEVFGQYWVIAKDWSESSRYKRFSQLEAEKLFNALTDTTNGVLPWVKKFW